METVNEVIPGRSESSFIHPLVELLVGRPKTRSTSEELPNNVVSLGGGPLLLRSLKDLFFGSQIFGGPRLCRGVSTCELRESSF